VRELRNVIERATVLAHGDVIMPADLPGHITRVLGEPGSKNGGPKSNGQRSAGGRSDSDGKNDASERQRIVNALEQCAGNQTRAAKLLGLSLRTLVNRLKMHNIPRPRSGLQQ
jgi:DNA-binding NtrC family response regulator